MDLTLTDEQELIRTTARELLEAKAPVAGARAMADDPQGYSDELWGEMVELGWTGLALSEEHGGVGMGFLELCLLLSELGYRQVPSPFAATALAGLAVAEFGPDEGRLGRIVAGEERWSVAGLSGEDDIEADGDSLHGEALFVPFADAVDMLLVVVGPTVFGVEASAVSTERLETTGNAPEFRVTFDGVTGEPLGEVADRVRQRATAALSAEMVGGAQRVLDMTVSYAKEREQFGRPIGTFQAIQHHCANMAMDVLGARFIAYEAIWRLGEGLDAAEEVSLAKSWVSDAYRRVCGLGHQVHGAIGFTEEFDLHHYFRHATSSELNLGDADHHRELVAQRLGL